MPRVSIIFIIIVILNTTACSQPESNVVNSHQHAVKGSYAAALNNDGSLAVVSSINDGLSVWDITNNAMRYQWRHQSGSDNLVFAIDISGDDTFVVTAERTKFAVWSLESGENIGYWQIQASSIRDIAISNQGRFVLYGRGDGKVVHIDLKTGRRIEFLGHTEKVNAVDLSPNGYYALSGANDYSAYLWDTRTGQVVHRFSHPSRVTQVALDRKGRIAFTADSKKQASIWNLQTGQHISNLQYQARQKIFSAIRFNADATLLLTGSPARSIDLWDVLTGNKLQTWQVSAKKDTRPKSAVVYDIAFGDNNQIISESSNGLSEIWQMKQ
jgi:WD40 repeat protein